MRVLIVRLSSMGDVVHTLPALTDAARANANIKFDWAVDEAFADIPAWHSHVENVFPVALRRWRRGLTSTAGRIEIKAHLKDLRRESYDAIVDLQGEFKSAFIARQARGPRYGYDGASAREWGAHVVYRNKFAVAQGEHSMARMRRLLSQALSYSYDVGLVDYGIARERLPSPALQTTKPYVVFIHSTSWSSKNWPEQYWRELAERATVAGLSVVLPWGSEAECERSRRIAAGVANVIVLPKLSISDKASIISRATATVGLDTGLSHIAAALDVPSVTLYGATDPNMCGTIGKNQIQITSEFECVNCHDTDCSFTKSAFKPACFEAMTPDSVWRRLEQLLGASVKSEHAYQIA
ncbi:MAG TPA: lipopolysaccharide heptosyltransferase I [Pyrinomonadaceae bacterium]